MHEHTFKVRETFEVNRRRQFRPHNERRIAVLLQQRFILMSDLYSRSIFAFFQLEWILKYSNLKKVQN